MYNRPSVGRSDLGGYNGSNYDPTFHRNRQNLPQPPQNNGYARESPRQETKRVGGKYIQPVDRVPQNSAPLPVPPLRESYRQPSPPRQPPPKGPPTTSPPPVSLISSPVSAVQVHPSRLAQIPAANIARPPPPPLRYSSSTENERNGEYRAYTPTVRSQPPVLLQTISSDTTPSPITPGAPTLNSLESIRQFRAQVQASRAIREAPGVDHSRLETLAESFLNSQHPAPLPQDTKEEEKEPGEISEPSSATTMPDERKSREILLKEKLLAARNQLQASKRDREDPRFGEQGGIKRPRAEDGVEPPVSAKSNGPPTGPRNPDVPLRSTASLPTLEKGRDISLGNREIRQADRQADPLREERAKQWNKSSLPPRPQTLPDDRGYLQPSEKNFVTQRYRNSQQRQSRSPVKRDDTSSKGRDSGGNRSLLERLSPLRHSPPPRPTSIPVPDNYHVVRQPSPPRGPPPDRGPVPLIDRMSLDRPRSPIASQRRSHSPPYTRRGPSPSSSYRRAPSPTPPHRRAPSPAATVGRASSPYRRPASPHSQRQAYDRPSSPRSYTGIAPAPHIRNEHDERGRSYDVPWDPYHREPQRETRVTHLEYALDPRTTGSAIDPQGHPVPHNHYEVPHHPYPPPLPPAANPAMVQTLAALKAQIAQLEAQMVSASAAVLIPPPPPPAGQYYAFPPPSRVLVDEHSSRRPPSPHRDYGRLPPPPPPPPARVEQEYRRAPAPDERYERPRSPPSNSFTPRGKGGHRGHGHPGSNADRRGGHASHHNGHFERSGGHHGGSGGFEGGRGRGGRGGGRGGAGRGGRGGGGRGFDRR